MRSTFLRLNVRDLLKGLLLAFITAVVTGVYELLQVASALNWETLKPTLLVAGAAALSYLIKNLFTNKEGEVLTTEK